jgi:hypothetical protein
MHLESDTAGWHAWAGEESADPEFFVPGTWST